MSENGHVFLNCTLSSRLIFIAYLHFNFRVDLAGSASEAR